MIKPIAIASCSSISALGSTSEQVWGSYLNLERHYLTIESCNQMPTPVGRLDHRAKREVDLLRKSDSKYRNLDDTVLFAILVSRKSLAKSNWPLQSEFGVNFGSSRGATQLFEKFHAEFLEKGLSSTLSSPTTTLGNISSWVANDLQSNSIEISHSITCSTALHSLLNGVAWLQSGLSSKFLVGGSEAPLTPFTIAQIKALRVYSEFVEEDYPCKALAIDKTKNSMVLGEGAASVCLESEVSSSTIAIISGIGYATEPLKHNTSVTANAVCFQRSMRMALGSVPIDQVDVVVMHAPGTKRGDSSELNAINIVFEENKPFLTTNKWKLGHTFGASGLLSLEFALLMIQHQLAIPLPYAFEQVKPKVIRNILVNAVGFGGNAVSVLLSRK